MSTARASRPPATAKFDPAPEMRPAGINLNADGSNAKQCFETITPPRTPDKMHKYRKSHTGEAGIRVQHWGTSEDARPDGTFTYGHKTGMRRDARGVLDGKQPSRVQEMLTQRNEAIYESAKLEPLGRTHGLYSIPPEKYEVSHGKRTASGEAAKDLVFPKDSAALSGTLDTPEVKQLYVKSHGTYEPGEQKRRDYSWPNGVNPDGHRFGAQDKDRTQDGVRKAINPCEEFESKVQPTTFLPKAVDNFQRVRGEELGKPRNLGLGRADLPEDHRFGMPSGGAEDWDAAQCVQGEYTLQQQMPDPDLGRSIRRGCAPPGVVADTSDRIFGVPSVRDDIVPPARLSVADTSNYGNEPTVKELLYPAPFADRGVNENDFLAPKTQAEISDLMLSSGAISSEATFKTVWNELSRDMGGSPETVSIDAFRRKMIQLSLEGAIDD